MPAAPKESAPNRRAFLSECPRNWRRSEIQPEASLAYLSQQFILQQMIAVLESRGVHRLPAFHLYFKDFQSGAIAAGYHYPASNGVHRSGFARRARAGACPRDPDGPASEVRIASGPGLEAANAVGDFRGRTGPVDEAVVFLENRRQRRLGGILRPGHDLAALQLRQRLHQQIG